jgi:endonuclease/exonuclease/phosphatase family metal-dependent hydrolase|tara:strand:+ start:709 stop:1419 length:711 start_codon:yes stop_codon:yes gene_type:complete
MKVLSWNCNCKFRDKYQLLDQYNADILIIQECEDPQQSSDSKYKSWAKNYLWVGDRKHQGLGVFAKTNIKLEALLPLSNNYKLFLPVLINNQYNLVGVWTKSASTLKKGYINQLWNFLLENREILDFSKIIITGDWNSNAKWDKKRSEGNHSDVVEFLKGKSVHSAYHYLQKLEHGCERAATFFLHRNIKKPYHFDYIFTHKSWLNKDCSFSLFKPTQWLKYSDHIPILLDTKNSI